MKRILTAILILTLCVGIVPAALAAPGCDAPKNPGVKVDVNVQVVVTPPDNNCNPPGCFYRPWRPDPWGCIEPPHYYNSYQCAVNLAIDNIRDHARSVLKLLDRELEGSGWTRIKNAQIKLAKTNRVIYNISVKKDDGSQRFDFYLVVRTPYNTVSTSCDPCAQKKCVPYYTMFVWNYNTGCRAKEYNDEWLITSFDVYADQACVELVTALYNGTISRF